MPARACSYLRCNKHRQACLRDIRREATMQNADAEKPSETQCLDAGVEAFQCPAEHLCANVDAEGHLQCWTRLQSRGSRRSEELAQLPLRRALGRLLQDCIDCIVRCRLDRRGIGAKRLFPLAS